MAKQKTKNIMNRFLQGWQQIFGGDRQEEAQNKLKPFPQNHYFRPEELDYLSKNRNLTTIEKWAVATGKWAFEQSKDKFSDCKYASVKWQDGLMATWVDGRIIPDTPSRQAEKLALLKEEGIEIPDKRRLSPITRQAVLWANISTMEMMLSRWKTTIKVI